MIEIIKKAHAQQLIPCPDGTMADPSIGCVYVPDSIVSTEANLTEMLLNFSVTFLAIVIAIAVLGIIYGGIQYALAIGIEEKIQRAKRTMLWSGIGLTIAIVARFVTNAILVAIT